MTLFDPHYNNTYLTRLTNALTKNALKDLTLVCLV